MSISVVIPAYKEAENLRILLPELNQVLLSLNEPHEILVVDTTEPMDNTSQVCAEFGARYVPRTNGNAYGDAIRTGIAEAAHQALLIMDGDGSHEPKEIPNFVEIYQQDNDLVIGSRYVKGGFTDNSFILKSMSLALNITYRLFFNIKINDVSNSFRLYDSQKLKSLELECDNFDIVEEILIKLFVRYQALKVKEHPIRFQKRMFGETKRDLVKFIFSYIFTIGKLLKIKYQYARKLG